MRAEERFFNFPIQLLNGFLSNPIFCLENIMYYSLFRHSKKMYLEDDPIENFKAAARYYNIELSNVKRAFTIGELLSEEEFVENCPHAGINLKVYWDYYKNPKTKFELACLVAYLALKSILGSKSYCKVDNKFWWARMDGSVKTCTVEELSDDIKAFANEYQTKKLKPALQLDWYLVSYGYRTRGFYVSFTLTKDQLVLEAEKRRLKIKLALLKREEKLAREKAILMLNQK